MPTRQVLHRKKRQSPIGDLDTRVTIHRRRQVPPVAGSVDAAFEFTPIEADGEVWAKVETRDGKTVFDGVANDRRVTHEVTIRALSGVGSESWVLLRDGTRLDVVVAETLDERQEFMRLSCDARGRDAKPASGR